MRKGIFAICLVLLTAMSAADRSAGQPSPPIEYLDQGWSDAERHGFYVEKQPGIWIMPYNWFEALELPASRADAIKMLKDPAIFKQYRLIVDPSLPNDLPVGFIKSAKQVIRPPGTPALLTNQYYLGQTCASCHTGQLTYKGKTYRVDGGSGMLDLLSFGQQLQGSLLATSAEPKRFGRFAKRLGKSTPAQQDELRAALAFLLAAMDNVSPLGIKPEDKPMLLRLYPFSWGFGRGDALGRGGNTLLAPLVAHDTQHPLGNGNRIPATAPVSTPHIWYSPLYDWVEWNGSIQNPMGRNIAQAITTGRRLSFANTAQPYLSDVDLDVLYELEHTIIRPLKAPRWPKDFPFQPGLVHNGKKLYLEHCARCHVPEPLPAPNAFGQIYEMYKRSMTPLNEIGTDPVMASNFYSRRVGSGKLQSVSNGAGGKPLLSASEAMQLITSGMMNAKNWTKTPSQPNDWRAPLAYIARLNAGIWATPPFLHNGSVPTLYALLSPRNERPSRFCVGNLEFDPVEVGYVSALNACSGGVFDTTLPGNSNAGHEHRDLAAYETPETATGRLGPYLKPEQRKEIVEYLKTCDLEMSGQPGWREAPVQLCGLTDHQ
jgi:mono/diheme cytochrome c family protein